MKANFKAMLEGSGLLVRSELAASSLMRASAEPYGDSVRLEKLKLGTGVYFEPPHLYLVYISMDNNGLIVRQYEKDINPARLVDEENNLIVAAKANSNANKVGENFQLIRFEQASFFTIVVDQPGWTFYYPDPNNPEPQYEGTHDPIVFTEQKTFIDESGATLSWPVVRNRSFYDLKSIDKTIGGEPRKGIRCINFFTKSADGDPIVAGDILNYTFNIFLRAPFSATVNQKVTIIIDPDGQNQGPPGAPPGGEDVGSSLVATEFAE
jgi:hypothetical protein